MSLRDVERHIGTLENTDTSIWTWLKDTADKISSKINDTIRSDYSPSTLIHETLQLQGIDLPGFISEIVWLSK